MQRERERRENAGHSGVYHDQRDVLHETVYGTDRNSYKLPEPHAPQMVSLGSDPHRIVTSNPTTDTIAAFLRRYLP